MQKPSINFRSVFNMFVYVLSDSIFNNTALELGLSEGKAWCRKTVNAADFL